ncbi:hypothetical protein [Photobacterium damselae]|uniref:hypothetical protein n=1 Tax=Photobacterium damselae TaxID=38293 RepID=UPI0030F37908
MKIVNIVLVSFFMFPLLSNASIMKDRGQSVASFKNEMLRIANLGDNNLIAPSFRPMKDRGESVASFKNEQLRIKSFE